MAVNGNERGASSKRGALQYYFRLVLVVGDSAERVAFDCSRRRDRPNILLRIAVIARAMLERGKLFAALRRRLFWIGAVAGAEIGLGGCEIVPAGTAGGAGQ